jgi:acyl carrier protein
MLKPEKVFPIVKKILSGECFGCDAEEITNSACLADDLGLDSLDHVELAMALEEALDLEYIDDDEMMRCTTVGQLVEMVCAKPPKAKSAKAKAGA